MNSSWKALGAVWLSNVLTDVGSQIIVMLHSTSGDALGALGEQAGC